MFGNGFRVFSTHLTCDKYNLYTGPISLLRLSIASVAWVDGDCCKKSTCVLHKALKGTYVNWDLLLDSKDLLRHPCWDVHNAQTRQIKVASLHIFGIPQLWDSVTLGSFLMLFVIRMITAEPCFRNTSLKHWKDIFIKKKTYWLFHCSQCQLSSTRCQLP